MVNRVIAIALNSIRQAIRSRLVISLILIMLVTAIGLPLTIKGDGTFAGKANILLFYTLGLSVIILGISTMWSSCSSISQEVAGQQIQLITVKPVTSFQLWFGKWIGMLIMNAILLLIAGATVYLLLMIEVKRSNLSEGELNTLYSEVLVGRRVITPRKESLHNKVHARIQELIKTGRVSPEVKDDEAFFNEMEKRLRATGFIVAPGKSRQWIFDIPESFSNKEKLAIRYKFSSSARDRKPVTVTWKIGTPEAPDNFIETKENSVDGSHTLYLPPESITPGTPAIVTFTNVETENINTLVFDQATNIQLMKKASSFWSNYIRSLLIIFFILALIAALGLTTGAFFSFPVATFITCAIITTSQSVHYFTVLAGTDNHIVCHEHKHENSGPTQGHVLTTKIVKGMEKYVSPSARYQPLAKLSNGILVSWIFTIRAALLLGLIYPSIMAVFGTLVLRSRELALPGRSK